MKIHLMGEPWEIQDVVAMIEEHVPIDSSSIPTRQHGGTCSVMVSINPEALARLHDRPAAAAEPARRVPTVAEMWDRFFGSGRAD